MRTLRMFRGLAVPASRRNEVIERITATGFVGSEGRWNIIHQHPGDINALFEHDDLTVELTRPNSVALPKVVCACGEMDGASYYASHHNRSEENDTPIIVEFEASLTDLAVDGRDFLYTVFQFGRPEAAREALQGAFGVGVLRYADKAWSSQDQGMRMALCDLAIHDPAVVEAHHANRTVIAGRYGTVFRNAFTVVCPVPPHHIRSVTAASSNFVQPQPVVLLQQLVQR